MWQRQQLVHLNPPAWQALGQAGQDEQARACFAWWAARRLPLVVTRQHRPGALSLGLPAPLCFDRRRLAIDVPHTAVVVAAAFPLAQPGLSSIAAAHRPAWRALCQRLADAGVAARVYGAHGWQLLSGLAYVHPASDIDLLLPVASAAMASHVCGLLAAADCPLPRLDGELIFPDGGAVAWREWQQWQAGQVDQVLVKHLDGARLLSPASALAAAC